MAYHIKEFRSFSPVEDTTDLFSKISVAAMSTRVERLYGVLLVSPLNRDNNFKSNFSRQVAIVDQELAALNEALATYDVDISAIKPQIEAYKNYLSNLTTVRKFIMENTYYGGPPPPLDAGNAVFVLIDYYAAFIASMIDIPLHNRVTNFEEVSRYLAVWMTWLQLQVTYSASMINVAVMKVYKVMTLEMFRRMSVRFQQVKDQLTLAENLMNPNDIKAINVTLYDDHETAMILEYLAFYNSLLLNTSQKFGAEVNFVDKEHPPIAPLQWIQDKFYLEGRLSLLAARWKRLVDHYTQTDKHEVTLLMVLSIVGFLLDAIVLTILLKLTVPLIRQFVRWSSASHKLRSLLSSRKTSHSISEQNSEHMNSTTNLNLKRTGTN
jgi:hypothetical protein